MHLEKKTGRIGNQRKNQEYPDHCIVKISSNIEKSSGDLRKLAVTQTPVNDHQ